MYFNKFIDEFVRLKKSVLMDKNDIAFIESNQKKVNYGDEFIDPNQEIVLIQIIPSYYEIFMMKKALERVNTKKNTVVGFIPKIKFYRFFDFFFLIKYLTSFFYYKLLFRKWKKLYRNIGVNCFIEDQVNFNIFNIRKAFNIYKKIDCKSEIVKIKHKDIIIGDLLYDGYLRYFNRATIKIDFNLFSLINYSVGLTHRIHKIIDKYTIVEFISNFTNYPNSGIPVRSFLLNEIKTSAIGHDLNWYKELNIKDYRRAPNHKKYREDFEKLNQKDQKIKLGLEKLEKRVSGKNDIIGMRNSSFNDNKAEIKKIDGVVFLHDLFDAQHIYDGGMVFNDIYEWTLFTLDIITKHSLNIGVKPHINQVPESYKLIKILKKKYPKVHWIDSKVSNKKIFEKIKFGVTIFGTVITELAHHNILPICCGDNPTSSFNYCLRATSKDEYEYYIVNYAEFTEKVIFKKNELGKFAYMHYFHKRDPLKIDRPNVNSSVLLNLN